MRALLLTLLLTGCAAHDWNCPRYGVRPGQPMGALVAINELADSDIERTCGKGAAGCVLEDERGLNLYYRNGDECTLRHELCHVMHGPHHTVDYQRGVIAGGARPTCPGS